MLATCEVFNAVLEIEIAGVVSMAFNMPRTLLASAVCVVFTKLFPRIEAITLSRPKTEVHCQIRLSDRHFHTDINMPGHQVSQESPRLIEPSGSVLSHPSSEGAEKLGPANYLLIHDKSRR